eukprot:7846991-Alexandrium_andersonii.AAC.1
MSEHVHGGCLAVGGRGGACLQKPLADELVSCPTLPYKALDGGHCHGSAGRVRDVALDRGEESARA